MFSKNETPSPFPDLPNGTEELFEFILRQVVISFSFSKRVAMVVGIIESFDEITNEIVLEYIFPRTDTSSHKIGKRRPLDNEKGENEISGRAILERQPQFAAYTKSDKAFDGLDQQIGSEIVAPLLDEDKVLGAISIQSETNIAFDLEDLKTLQSFAKLIVIVGKERKYQNQLKELKRIKGLVGSRTAIDWMRMVSTSWGHAIKRESGLALRYLELIYQGLEAGESVQVHLDLAHLRTVVERIKDIPIVAPLAKEDTTMRLSINDLIQKHIDRIWQHEPYRYAKLVWDLQPDLDNIATVKASPQWLLRAIEILLDNAIQAMFDTEVSKKQIVVSTKMEGTNIHVKLKDSGPGIPIKIKDIIFNEPIAKSQGTRGAGLGLIQAKTIVETYGGEIYVESTGPKGTTFVITLPTIKN